MSDLSENRKKIAAVLSLVILLGLIITALVYGKWRSGHNEETDLILETAQEGEGSDDTERNGTDRSKVNDILASSGFDPMETEAKGPGTEEEDEDGDERTETTGEGGTGTTGDGSGDTGDSLTVSTTAVEAGGQLSGSTGRIRQPVGIWKWLGRRGTPH